LKLCFLDLAKVARYVAAQEVENDFAGTSEPLKIRFLDIAKVAFYVT
jgi:hypothetical protein